MGNSTVSRTVFSTKGDFAPQGTFANVWRLFWLSLLGECNWHLVGRGHMPLNIYKALTTRNYPAQNVSSSKVEKPCPGVTRLNPGSVTF